MKWLRSIFKKDKEISFVEPAFDDTALPDKLDLPPLEEEMPTQGFFHKAMPRVTKLNKKILFGVIGVFLLVFGWSFWYSMSRQMVSKDTMAQVADNPRDVGTVTTPLFTPEAATYTEATRQTTPQRGSLTGSNQAEQKANAIHASAAQVPPTQNQTPRPAQLPLYPNYSGSVTIVDKEVQDARRSPIAFFTGQTSAPPANAGVQGGGGIEVSPVSTSLPNAGGASSAQDEKRQFIQQNANAVFYARSQQMAPVSTFELKAGTIIPAVLLSGINSDLPGRIVGQVSDPVYDTVTGQHLLIPQGTKVIGTYDSKVSFAQERVLVVWNRLIYPNGVSFDLEGAQGTDVHGYSGFTGKVNTHSGKMVRAGLLTSILSAAAAVATGTTSSDQMSYGQLAGQGIATNIADIGSKIVERNMNVQPTIEIPPGYIFNIFIEKDFILRPYRE